MAAGNDTVNIKVKYIPDTSDLKNILYFELTTKDRDGKENVYQLQLPLSEITKSNSEN